MIMWELLIPSVILLVVLLIIRKRRKEAAATKAAANEHESLAPRAQTPPKPVMNPYRGQTRRRYGETGTELDDGFIDDMTDVAVGVGIAVAAGSAVADVEAADEFRAQVDDIVEESGADLNRRVDWPTTSEPEPIRSQIDNIVAEDTKRDSTPSYTSSFEPSSSYDSGSSDSGGGYSSDD